MLFDDSKTLIEYQRDCPCLSCVNDKFLLSCYHTMHRTNHAEWIDVDIAPHMKKRIVHVILKGVYDDEQMSVEHSMCF